MTQIICKECGNQYPEEQNECNNCGCLKESNASNPESQSTFVKAEVAAVNNVKEKMGPAKKWFEILVLLPSHLVQQ